jgi:choline kinase
VIGLILAAGAGTRLNGGDAILPKCLATFEGTTLIDLQMQVLRSFGIDDIGVVVGFQADRVRRACGPDVRFLENRVYAETNSLYSLWLARPLLGNGFVVLNCDVLFHPAMLSDLLSARHADALLVAYPEQGQPPFTDEEMKVSVRRGRVVDMRKDLPASDTDGENVGIVKFSAASAARLIAHLDRRVGSGAKRDWAPRAFADFAREEPLYAVSTRGLPWIEIDTPEDYRRAASEVFPAIRDALGEMAPAIRWRAS